MKRFFIGYPRAFLDMTNFDHKAALLLNQLCYWSAWHRKEEIFREQGKWYTEIGLTLKEVQRALKILKEKNFITTARHLVKGTVTTFYTINWVLIRSSVFEVDEYFQGVIKTRKTKKRTSGNDKKVIPEKDKKEFPEKDIRAITAFDKKSTPLVATKSDLPNYSSEVNNSTVHSQSIISEDTSTYENGVKLHNGYPASWDNL